MILVNNIPLDIHLAEQSSIAILKEFNRSTNCHSFYHIQPKTQPTKRYRASKPVIIPKTQVFYYYLNQLSSKLINKFNSLTTTKQQAIRKLFATKPLTSSHQAIKTITSAIK